jgi:aspartate/methionine/tyrosine aminotransferase
MVPGPVQAAAAAALADDGHVEDQRDVYRRRLELLVEIFARIGLPADLPGGGFYLWVKAPEGDAWGLTQLLARDGGALVSPGEFYGPDGAGHVRVAAVQPDERLHLLGERLSG